MTRWELSLFTCYSGKNTVLRVKGPRFCSQLCHRAVTRDEQQQVTPLGLFPHP